ncbi:MAG: hypothetical protein A2908_01005 [Candidatus Staskawiczbacteria bacterium RIFCSPLOWO2_01_FULL_38_12b]|uniref:HD domain-containing protein n=1 Tax=Candidatus Staskawiczbacteria bacterium RIFCSPLOWO2_01_FULL_38_12b TaxID=1802214 RepID=A0A1G2IB95_9BACT|nr:MAG: hypothetical protein A2908_01005 [Candidatus Staskawiczbacteria bacterium RIFCSPLOWO2_01_FULL_38_12b]
MHLPFEEMKVRLESLRCLASDHIGTNYEESRDPYQQRPYHSRWHTFDTHARFVSLASAVRNRNPDLISESDIMAGEAAAFAHDTDQTCMYVTGPFGKMRKRFSGPIEGASAIWCIRMMDQVGGFTPSQKEVAAEAIMGTVPAWDGVKNRLIQPNLRPGVKLATILLAIADLGGGVMGGTAFAKEGRLVFVEDNLFVLEALLETGMRDVPSNAQFLCEKIVAYMGSQIGFLKGVADRLEEEILPLVLVEVRDPIRSVCTGTTAADKACRGVWEWTQEMADKKDYMNLFRFMGYRV